MNRSLLWKLCLIGATMIVLIIPIGMINGLLTERKAHRAEVVQDIARSSAYAQQLTGPVLVVPYTHIERESSVDARTGARRVEEHEVRAQLYLLPERLELDGNLRTEPRNRGIYEARLYHAATSIRGHFDVAAHFGVEGDPSDYRFGEPWLALGVSDIRGIGNALRLTFNGAESAFLPGSSLAMLGTGVHAPLPALDATRALQLEFDVQLALTGTDKLEIAPVGRETLVTLRADWPHPSFEGEFLPAQREVSDDGFEAHWQTSFFATNMPDKLAQCARNASCEKLDPQRLGVSLIDPVDHYLKSERAIKYSVLFIALTFAGFFLCEVLQRAAVHPVQYGLVGLSLALFFLLLLSLSEHLGFDAAYLLAALACVGLNGFYVRHVLGGWTAGIAFGGALAALYALLYGLLAAEDYALLMGSLLLFGLVGLFMILTRRIDWFRLPTRQEVA